MIPIVEYPRYDILKNLSVVYGKTDSEVIAITLGVNL